MYMSAINDPIITTAATGHWPCSRAACTRYHLLTKPTVRGTPIRLRPPPTNAAIVHGITLPRPCIFSMRTEPTRYMMQPIAMNSAPFISA